MDLAWLEGSKKEENDQKISLEATGIIQGSGGQVDELDFILGPMGADKNKCRNGIIQLAFSEDTLTAR